MTSQRPSTTIFRSLHPREIPSKRSWDVAVTRLWWRTCRKHNPATTTGGEAWKIKQRWWSFSLYQSAVSSKFKCDDCSSCCLKASHETETAGVWIWLKPVLCLFLVAKWHTACENMLTHICSKYIICSQGKNKSEWRKGWYEYHVGNPLDFKNEVSVVE